MDVEVRFISIRVVAIRRVEISVWIVVKHHGYPLTFVGWRIGRKHVLC